MDEAVARIVSTDSSVSDARTTIRATAASTASRRSSSAGDVYRKIVRDDAAGCRMSMSSASGMAGHGWVVGWRMSSEAMTVCRLDDGKDEEEEAGTMAVAMSLMAMNDDNELNDR